MGLIITLIAVIFASLAGFSIATKEKITVFAFSCTLVAVLTLLSGLYVGPIYNVWKQGLSGEAALAKAAQTKQIMIQTSLAEKESAQNKADAIIIMGQAAKDYPEYRQQEFMTALGEALREGNISQMMYIPTEAMIPITEAGKR